MELETLRYSEIILSGDTRPFEKIGVEVPLRYYAFENQGKIIQRGDTYLYFEEIGDQTNGFRGIEADLSLVKGEHGYFYLMDIYVDFNGDFKRDVKKFAPYEFEKVFAEFKDIILKYKGFFGNNCLDYYQIEVICNGQDMNDNQNDKRLPENRAKIEYGKVKKMWENYPGAEVKLTKLDLM